MAAPVTDTIKQELEAIFEDRGQLTANDIVNVAADEAHPLHRFFEWDDTVAGANFRLLQAGYLVRRVKINVVTRTDAGEIEDFKVRAFTALQQAGDVTAPAGYVPQAVVASSPTHREIVLMQMQREMQGMRKRFGHLPQFWLQLDQLREQGPVEAATG